MLTPEINDTNRKSELKRKEQDPRSFGTPRLDVKEATTRKLEGNKLVTEKGLQGAEEQTAKGTETEEQTAKGTETEEQTAKGTETEEQRLAREAAEQTAKDEAARVRKEWEEYLDQPVNVLVNELAAVQDVEQLAVMQVVEAETKNRKTLIEAIAAEIAKRGE